MAINRRPQSIPEVQDARNLKLPYERLFEVMRGSTEAQRQIEWYFNYAKNSYDVKKYVTGFVGFLRDQLNVTSGSLPAVWVVKSFGLNLDVDYSDSMFPNEPLDHIKNQNS